MKLTGVQDTQPVNFRWDWQKNTQMKTEATHIVVKAQLIYFSVRYA